MLENVELRRRTLLQGALILVGATAVTGVGIGALVHGAQKSGGFLDEETLATLSAACDTLIPETDTPGALAAGVPQTFDALLASWASPATRQLIVGALDRLDKAARKNKGMRFDQLSAEERKAFLTEYDRAALKPVPPSPNTKPAHPFAPLVSVADNGWHRVKDLTITLYYMSEIGLTQELVYEHVPGPWVPSLKITPGMRPFAGTGPF